MWHPIHNIPPRFLRPVYNATMVNSLFGEANNVFTDLSFDLHKKSDSYAQARHSKRRTFYADEEYLSPYQIPSNFCKVFGDHFVDIFDSTIFNVLWADYARINTFDDTFIAIGFQDDFACDNIFEHVVSGIP